MELIPVYHMCGCCGFLHKPGYRGDCRNDSERFIFDQLEQLHGKLGEGWEYVDLDDPQARESVVTYNDCAHELRAAGYNHTDSNRYAKILPRRKLAWARIVADESGNHSIQYDSKQESTS